MATNQIDVRAGVSAVWAVLADGWNYSNWVVGTSHMRAVEDAWPAVGSRLFHCAGTWPLAIRDHTVVEVCEPDHRLVMTAVGRPFGSARIELVLTGGDARCRVTMREEPDRGPGRLLRNRVSDAVLHRRNTEALHRLAAVCERRTEPAG